MRKIEINKRLRIGLIFLSAFIITLILTWYLSGQTGKQSNDASHTLARYIERLLSKYFDVNKSDFFWSDTLNEVLRKAGHFTEYVFLGAFLGAFIIIIRRRVWFTLLVSGVTGFILAYIDELRQGLVPGRTPRTFDVMVDTAGVFTGLAIICVAYVILSYIWKLEKRIKELEEK